MSLADREYKLRKKLVEFFELPRDVAMNLPRLTLLGNLQFYIENHRGVVSYSSEEIRVNMKRGEFRIYGRDLVIDLILREELIIYGEIEGIRFLPGGE